MMCEVMVIKKIPGPNGYAFVFIKNIRILWRIIIKDVKCFEENGIINSGSNVSFITLVPKVGDPICLVDFRPINLMGCVYKIISKVTAGRLKNVISSIVSKEQYAYIKERNIMDSPLMVNETVT